MPHPCAQAYSVPERFTPRSRTARPAESTSWFPCTRTVGAPCGGGGGGGAPPPPPVVPPPRGRTPGRGGGPPPPPPPRGPPAGGEREHPDTPHTAKTPC